MSIFFCSPKEGQKKIRSNGSSAHRFMKSNTYQRIDRNKVINENSYKAVCFDWKIGERATWLRYNSKNLLLYGIWLIEEFVMLRAYEAFLIKKGTIKSQYVPFYLKWVSNCYAFLNESFSNRLGNEQKK